MEYFQSIAEEFEISDVFNTQLNEAELEQVSFELEYLAEEEENKGIVKKIVDFIKKIVDWFKRTIVKIWNKITVFFKKIFDYMKNLAKKFKELIQRKKKGEEPEKSSANDKLLTYDGPEAPDTSDIVKAPGGGGSGDSASSRRSSTSKRRMITTDTPKQSTPPKESEPSEIGYHRFLEAINPHDTLQGKKNFKILNIMLKTSVKQLNNPEWLRDTSSEINRKYTPFAIYAAQVEKETWVEESVVDLPLKSLKSLHDTIYNETEVFMLTYLVRPFEKYKDIIKNMVTALERVSKKAPNVEQAQARKSLATALAKVSSDLTSVDTYAVKITKRNAAAMFKLYKMIKSRR